MARPNAGCLVWGVAAAVGASALLVASETAYRVLTLAGAVYLVWLGLHLLWTSFRRGGDDGLPAATPGRGSLWVSWLTGLGTNILNPKSGCSTWRPFRSSFPRERRRC